MWFSNFTPNRDSFWGSTYTQIDLYMSIYGSTFVNKPVGDWFAR